VLEQRVCRSAAGVSKVDILDGCAAELKSELRVCCRLVNSDFLDGLTDRARREIRKHLQVEVRVDGDGTAFPVCGL
jgi:hypothetical protein